MKSTRAVRLLTLVACGLLSGACATAHYTQSRIATEATDRATTHARFRVQGLKVAIETLDRTPEETPSRDLGLRVVLEPDELGYSFDPGQVVLRNAEGREWRAWKHGYHPIHSETSFDLHFDAAVEPDARLELVVGGLARGPHRLPPATFRVALGHGRSYRGAPWLEKVGLVVGYAIIIPIGVASYAVYGP